MREYYEQLWAHTSDEVDQTTRTLPRQTENLYRQMSIKETESLINNFPRNKVSHGHTSEVYQTLKKYQFSKIYAGKERKHPASCHIKLLN